MTFIVRGSTLKWFTCGSRNFFRGFLSRDSSVYILISWPKIIKVCTSIYDCWASHSKNMDINLLLWKLLLLWFHAVHEILEPGCRDLRELVRAHQVLLGKLYFYMELHWIKRPKYVHTLGHNMCFNADLGPVSVIQKQKQKSMIL